MLAHNWWPKSGKLLPILGERYAVFRRLMRGEVLLVGRPPPTENWSVGEHQILNCRDNVFNDGIVFGLIMQNFSELTITCWPLATASLSLFLKAVTLVSFEFGFESK